MSAKSPLSVVEVYRRVAVGEWTPERGAELLMAMAELERARTDTIVRGALVLLLLGAFIFIAATGHI